MPTLYNLANLSADAIQQRVKELRGTALHTKPGSEQGTGLFQHDALQTCTNLFLFNAKDDIGVVFNGYFKVLSLEALAFFCTILEFLIEEFESGVQKGEALDADNQLTSYSTHLKNAQLWSGIAVDRYKLVREQLPKRALKQSGAVLALPPKADPNLLILPTNIAADVPDEHEIRQWNEEAGLDETETGPDGSWGAGEHLTWPTDEGENHGDRHAQGEYGLVDARYVTGDQAGRQVAGDYEVGGDPEHRDNGSYLNNAGGYDNGGRQYPHRDGRFGGHEGYAGGDGGEDEGGGWEFGEGGDYPAGDGGGYLAEGQGYRDGDDSAMVVNGGGDGAAYDAEPEWDPNATNLETQAYQG